MNEGLKKAQHDVNRMQNIIEAAFTCLVEPRLGYRVDQFNLMEVYAPSRRIDVLAGVATLASTTISGLAFLMTYGVPNQSEDRLLGRSKFALLNTHGVITGFSNLSAFSPTIQNKKLELYN